MDQINGAIGSANGTLGDLKQYLDEIDSAESSRAVALNVALVPTAGAPLLALGLWRCGATSVWPWNVLAATSWTLSLV